MLAHETHELSTEWESTALCEIIIRVTWVIITNCRYMWTATIESLKSEIWDFANCIFSKCTGSDLSFDTKVVLLVLEFSKL